MPGGRWCMVELGCDKTRLRRSVFVVPSNCEITPEFFLLTAERKIRKSIRSSEKIPKRSRNNAQPGGAKYHVRGLAQPRSHLPQPPFLSTMGADHRDARRRSDSDRCRIRLAVRARETPGLAGAGHAGRCRRWFGSTLVCPARRSGAPAGIRPQVGPPKELGGGGARLSRRRRGQSGTRARSTGPRRPHVQPL